MNAVEKLEGNFHSPEGSGKDIKTLAQPKTSADALELIKNGIENILDGETWKKYLRMISLLHRYSANNIMLIQMQYPEATIVAGATTWFKLGRKPIKGCNKIRILRPSPYKKKEFQELSDGTLEVVNEEQKMGYTIGYVLDISQTEGEDLPMLYGDLKGECNHLLSLLDHCTFPVHIVDKMPYQANALGVFVHDTHEIYIQESLDDLAKTRVLIHEWAHGIAHTSPENRNKSSQTKEVEAESIAFCVCHALGIDTSDVSFGYITEWGGGEMALKRLKDSSRFIQQKVHEILEKIVPSAGVIGKGEE